MNKIKTNLDIIKDKKIIVVEDEKINQKLIQLLLKKAKAVTFTAKNSKELYAILEQENYNIDLILLDYLLENKEDGVGILKELNENKLKLKQKDIPIIFLTGSIEEKILEEAFAAGAVDFIQKPYKKTEILLRTKTHLTLSSLLDNFRKLAHYDSLTQIFNRRRFFELAVPLFQREKNIYMFMLDIDNFKQINDTYGHDIGDKVLKIFANTLKDSVKDSIIARFGGEEFTVTGIFKDKKEIKEIVEKLKNNINNIRIQLDDENTLNFSASIGISTKNENMISIDELLKEADKALYYVKTNGKNNYKFYDEIKNNTEKLETQKVRTRK